MNIFLTRRQLLSAIALGGVLSTLSTRTLAEQKGPHTMPQIDFTQLASTYSIVAHDPNTGELGVAVQTHQMGVGRLVPWVQGA